MVDAFTLPESNMVARGNFLSLMFFVMGVGSLLTFFGLGSMTSYVAQVSKTALAIARIATL